MGATKGGRGRPPTPPSVAADRRARWRHAVSFSGLKQPEIAAMIGRSVSCVASYGARTGYVPTEEAIGNLESYNRARLEREIDRLQADAPGVTVTDSDVAAIQRGRAQVADGDVHDMEDVLDELDDLLCGR